MDNLTGRPFFEAMAMRNHRVAATYRARAEAAKRDREARGVPHPEAIRMEGGRCT